MGAASGAGGGARVAALQHTDPAAAAETVAARELDRPQQQLEADGAGEVVYRRIGTRRRHGRLRDGVLMLKLTR